METACVRESGRNCKQTYFPSHAHIRWPSHNRSVVLTTRCTHTTLGLSANKCICLLVARINSIFYGRRRLPLVGSLRMESTRYRLLVPRDSEVLRFYHSYAIVIVRRKFIKIFISFAPCNRSICVWRTVWLGVAMQAQ